MVAVVLDKKYYIYLLGALLAVMIGAITSFSPYISVALCIVSGVSVLLFVALTGYHKKTMSFLLTMLLISLYLFPDITISGLGFRFDDFLAIFMSFGLLFLVAKSKATDAIQAPIVFKWLVIYLIYSGAISTVALLFGELESIYLLFFVKEIQYFVYLVACYYLIKSYPKFDTTFRKAFSILSAVTILWGIYQLLTGNIRGYYGIGIISNQTPSQSGILLLMTTLMLLYFSISTTKKHSQLFFLISALLAAAMTIATISRTAILGLVAIFGLYIFFSMFRRKWNHKKIAISIFLVLAVIPLSYQMISSMIASVFERFSRFGHSANYRWNNWEYFLSHSDTLGHIFGNGKGFMQVIVGNFTLSADNMYVRLLVEVGAIGLALWMIFIFSILFYSLVNIKKSFNESMFLMILTLLFMITSVTQESYLVSIQGSMYWLLTGYFLAKISLKKEKLATDSGIAK